MAHQITIGVEGQDGAATVPVDIGQLAVEHYLHPAWEELGGHGQLGWPHRVAALGPGHPEHLRRGLPGEARRCSGDRAWLNPQQPLAVLFPRVESENESK